jgi:hypothetical protein
MAHKIRESLNFETKVQCYLHRTFVSGSKSKQQGKAKAMASLVERTFLSVLRADKNDSSLGAPNARQKQKRHSLTQHLPSVAAPLYEPL